MSRIPLVALFVLTTLSGCASIYPEPPSVVHQPMSVRPETRPQVAAGNGSIYQASLSRPLFEDRRARHVGDTITINLVERNTAQKSANANASRDGSIKAGVGPIAGLPLKTLNGLALEATTESDFSGQGGAAANNVFNGTITVTVIDVYPNGNLLVSGEKLVAINQGNEYIRFSGVINPNSVTAGNTVQSTQVADARMEYRGSGFINESTAMGWLQRFFVAILPF